MALQDVPLSKIRTDGGTQQRVSIIQEKVEEYAERMADMPAVKIKFDGSDFWLWDGFHRYHAARKAGVKTISAVVEKGTQREAQLASFKANSTNGIHRSNADKRKAVSSMLDDAEWGKWPNTRIAQACDVSESLVRAQRDEREKSTFDASKQDESKPLHSFKRMEGGKSEADSDEEGCSDSPEDEDFDPFEAGEGEGTPAAPPPEAPARRPAAPAITAAPAETKGSDPQADATAGENPEPTDEEGNPLPDDPKIREAFAAGERFDRAMSLLSQAVGEVSGLMGDGKETKASPGGQWLDSEQQSFLRDVKNARSTLKATRPYALCPYPHGGNKCEACKGLGWVVKSTWKNAPKDYHAGLKARAGKAGKEGRAA